MLKDTTKEEREQIVSDVLGNISASCDGCRPELTEMYQAYIDEEKEIKDINIEFQAWYVFGEDVPSMERGVVPYTGRMQINDYWKTASWRDAVFCAES